MKAFISYSHRDSEALKRLHVHLASLKREGRIQAWYDRDILAGDDLDAEIKEQLEDCELFLLMVSPDFLASEYCVETEMSRALERHDAREARVVPIIIEPCDWTNSPLRALKAVPLDGKPVSEWTNQNTAYLNVIQELRRILDQEPPAPAPDAKVDAEDAEPIVPSAERRYRVKRDFDDIDRAEYKEKAFGTIRSYFKNAIEELDAELGAAFLCADLELTPEPGFDHAAYIQSWLKVLKEDKRAIFAAAAHAQRAADFLHGLQPLIEEEQAEGVAA